MLKATLYNPPSPALNQERGMMVWGDGRCLFFIFYLGNKPLNVFGGHTGNLALVIDGEQRDLNAFSCSKNSSSVIILCSPRSARFTSSNALSRVSLMYFCWRRVLLSAFFWNTMVEATPRSSSMALRTDCVATSSFSVTNICVIILTYLVSGRKFTINN